MPKARVLLAFVGSLVVSFAVGADLPTVVIVQDKVVPKKDEADINLTVADTLAGEIDYQGLMKPVVWSITDPTFRDALLSGPLVNSPEKPTLEQAVAGATKLRAEYVIWLKATSGGSKSICSIKLYRGSKQIWKDDRVMTVAIGGQTSDSDTAKSLSRTWVALMSTGPLKGIKPQPKIVEPTIGPGQAPPKIDSGQSALVAVTVNNDQLRKDTSALIAGDRRQEAILKVRDAVDEKPFDYDRRQLLIEVLLGYDPLMAAAEARRVAALMPDHPEMRVVAARAWIRGGKPVEAREDLNEAIARDPNGAPIRLLLAEINLSDGKPASALDDIEPVVKSNDSGEARFLRALCRALLGGADGVAKDLAEYAKLVPEPTSDDIARHYGLGIRAIVAATNKAFDDEKSVLAKAALKPKSQEVADEIERLLREAQSRQILVSSLVVPIGKNNSHQRRLLGLRLLVQSLTDAQRYLTAPDEDTMSDARMNLGEAIKHIQAAHDAYEKGS